MLPLCDAMLWGKTDLPALVEILVQFGLIERDTVHTTQHGVVTNGLTLCGASPVLCCAIPVLRDAFVMHCRAVTCAV
jgi:hypothetical protein